MGKNRSGERNGWTLGWAGSYLWMLILALATFLKGQLLPGLVGLGLVAAAVVVIVRLPPWRYPAQPYWRLMLPLYLLFGLGVCWLIWLAGGVRALGLNAWSIFLLLPLLLPFYLAGRRRWIDGGDQEGRT